MPRIFSAGIFVFLLLAVSIFPVFALSDSGPASASNTGNTCQSQNVQLYQINIVEKGLPKGMLWNVGIYEAPPNQTFPVALSKSSRNSTVTFNEPAGTYSFSGFADGAFTTKSFYIYGTVVNASITLSMPFIELYNISVTEHGLPLGYDWGMSVFSTTDFNNNGGHSGPPMRQTLSMEFSNGTYNVSAGLVIDSIMNNYSFYSNVGVVTVNGSSVNLTVQFYPVNLTVTNLPSNVSWGFKSIGGLLFPGTPRNMNLFLINGTYGVQPLAKGYYSNNVTFTVSGPGKNISVSFEKEFPVKLHEKGLPSTLEYWSVAGLLKTYDGFPANFNTSNLTYMVPNGTYFLTVSPTGSFRLYINHTLYIVNVSVSPETFSIIVSGNSTSINVTFNATFALVPQKNPSSPNGINLLYNPYLYLVTAWLLAATLMAMYFYRKRKR